MRKTEPYVGPFVASFGDNKVALLGGVIRQGQFVSH